VIASRGLPAQNITVAVLGLGEAGGAISADLVAAGARVRGYDPAVRPGAGLVGCSGEADAASGADVVLSVNSAEAAEDALRAGLPGMRHGAIWADLNTAAPALKRRLGDIAARAGVALADVSLMAPVPRKGLRTPMLASGPAAAGYAGILEPLGARITVLDAPAGAAATRKLLRSVFFKGMAAAIVEALRAAREAGLEDWLRAHIADELGSADGQFAQRLEEGSYQHAERRVEEMRAASDLLAELNVPSRVSEASREWLVQLASERAAEADDVWSGG
jgi:3-hydroxyisobutyrate dehydrogenase-like beta-hydroxyacid dehydrogenase